MSQYSHDLRKFSDLGLQLRLPVDLVPAGQYGKLTNALPVIEGEIRSRDGVIFIARLTDYALISVLSRAGIGLFIASIATTVYPHGFTAGDNVTIVVTGISPLTLNAVTLGTYNVVIQSVPSPTTFTFSPGIPGAWGATELNVPVFAQVTKSSGALTTLTNTAINTIFRLNEAVPSINGDRLVSMAGRLFYAPLPQGRVFQEAILPPTSFVVIITTISRTAGLVTALIPPSLPFSLSPGIAITIAGVSDPSFDGTFSVVAVTANFVGGTLIGYTIDWFQAGPDTGFIHSGQMSVQSLLPLSPTTPNGFSGNPLSIISFRFTDDPISWAIIADANKMAKFRPTIAGGIYFFLLGNPQPTVPASASADGAGNLDSTGGALYDWRYTYYDGYVNTEGNPSPGTDAAVVTTENSTAQVNPDPRFNTGGAFPFTNDAFTGVSNTGGTGTATQIDTTTFHQTSCKWIGFANPPTTPFTITLSITWEAIITQVNTAPVLAELQYSVNNGVSFTVFDFVAATSGTRVATVTLPLGTDFTQVQFSSWGFCNVDFAGGGTGNSVTVNILNIEIDGAATPVSGAIACVNQKALVCVTPPGALNDGRITGIRLYRRGGSLPDAWRLVGTFPLSGLVQGGCGVGTLEITDNVSDTQLSTQPILEFDNDPPVTSINTTNQPLNFIWGPVGLEARVLGCGDPNRPECVYFSKPGNPDAWPPQNFVEVCDPGTPIIAGCVYNTRTYAYSRESIYELIEGLGTGTVFSPFKTPSVHGLYTPWGLALGPSMYFIAKDGIYETSGGQEVSIVENDIKPLFPTYDHPGQDVEGYEAPDYSLPNNMRLRYHNSELYFVYTGKTSQTQRCLVYDLLKKRWRAADYAAHGLSEVYSEPATTSSLLFGMPTGELESSGGFQDPDGTGVAITLRTGSQDQGVPLNRKQYGNVIIDLDPGGATSLDPVTITPFINGEVSSQPPLLVFGTGRRQVPLDLSDFFAFNVELQVTWRTDPLGGGAFINPILFQYDILHFLEPAGLTHWQSQPSSMDMTGFLHVRDIYVAIRSSAPVTMAMTFDGTTQTYTIPSTGGVRQKVYIQLDSNKGLLYNWAFDSEVEFRIYVEDVEVRAKSWLSVLGYSITKPFGAEVAGAQ